MMRAKCVNEQLGTAPKLDPNLSVMKFGQIGHAGDARNLTRLLAVVARSGR